jgi:hypothetical protein
MPRREFASERALKKHAELNGDFYAWESSATYAKWQSLLSRDQYEIVEVPTSQGVRRAMLFPKAILKAEWELDGPLREALGLKRGGPHEKSRKPR